ncbi:MAG: ATP synthase F1 subunit gamma [Cyanobacteria bacterium SZAS LIN-2]|nr:ATP synthase F1 subunit gamma [Cyanobacteria bacterium SZAS LIN-3]MBS1999468.1 ATP synthase F1 subunit gamma [Cyanobacteria bacterium SZAS LIN-2]MBS2009260.1 ATP synthase F1 subunit gamma [Cyanobacteria bacterium SZAS TMP-1]
MANLKAIRQRIRSVQSTQKITRAMKMVAAAKVRRAQGRVLAARPFTQGIIRILREVMAEVSPVDLQGLYLLNRRQIKKVAIIVISSDRGLCGSYNSTVFRDVLARITALRAEGKEVGLMLVGLKAVSFFKHIKVEKLGKPFTLLPAIPTVEEAKLIAGQASEFFTSGQVDAIEIIGTDFLSLLRSEVKNTQYLPIQLPQAEEHKALNPIRLFEPDIIDVMERELLPKYIENTIYQALLEASASELAARMNAMTNASNNARDLISSLTLIYNKARQASITQELLEIVGGAEALKG